MFNAPIVAGLNAIYDFADSVTESLVGQPVQAGDLVIVWCTWAGDGLTASVSDGFSTFVPCSVNNAGVWPTAHGQFFYCLSSVAVGLPDYTLSVPGAFGPAIDVWVYRPSSHAIFDVELATASLGGAGSTSVDAGALATTGVDELVFCGFFTEANPDVNAYAIGGVDASTGAYSFYYGLTIGTFYLETIGTVHPIATLGSAQKWLANAISFKIADAPTANKVGSLLMAYQ